jgi:hypothetical protein
VGRLEIKAGDILGFSGSTWLSAGINLATYGIPFWGISHVGIVADYSNGWFPCLTQYSNLSWDKDPLLYLGDNERLLLFESTMFSPMPCAIQGRKVDGVQAHPVWDAIAEYNGRIWHYSLRRKLRPLESQRLMAFLLQHISKRYDAIGALRAGGVGFSWIESLLRKEDLESLFCSELCAAAHRNIGLFDTGHASKWSPNAFVRAERRAAVLLHPRRLK